MKSTKEWDGFLSSLKSQNHISKEDFLKSAPFGGSIKLEEFLLRCKEYDFDFDVYLILPNGQLKSFALFFPQFIRTVERKPKILEIENNVLYNKELYPYERFLKKFKVLNFKEIRYLKLPFYLFIVHQDVFRLIKQNYLTEVRRFFGKMGIIEHGTGKWDRDIKHNMSEIADDLKEQKAFYLAELKRIQKASPKISRHKACSSINNAWQEIAQERYSENTVEHKRKLRRIEGSISTVRRFLEPHWSPKK